MPTRGYRQLMICLRDARVKEGYLRAVERYERQPKV